MREAGADQLVGVRGVTFMSCCGVVVVFPRALELLVFVLFVAERELEKVVVRFACREHE